MPFLWRHINVSVTGRLSKVYFVRVTSDLLWRGLQKAWNFNKIKTAKRRSKTEGSLIGKWLRNEVIF
jgi:hypothetical protein